MSTEPKHVTHVTHGSWFLAQLANGSFDSGIWVNSAFNNCAFLTSNFDRRIFTPFYPLTFRALQLCEFPLETKVQFTGCWIQPRCRQQEQTNFQRRVQKRDSLTWVAPGCQLFVHMFCGEEGNKLNFDRWCSKVTDFDSWLTSLSLFFAAYQMDLVNKVYGGWRYLMDDLSDPRTNDWPLMSSPFPTIAISLTYAYCVKVSWQHCCGADS